MAQRKKVPIPTLFKLWRSEINTKDICIQLGVSDSYLRRLVKQHKLPPRENGNNGKTRIIDPTPEELEQLMAETRAGWSAKEADQRYCGQKRESWQIPSYTYDARTGGYLRD
jgi:hypothetical protein